MGDKRAATTILAIDYGLRRVGIAVGQTVSGSATPVSTIDTRSATEVDKRVRELIADWRPDVIVVGMPVTDYGDGELGPAIRRFGARLAAQGHAVEYVDERLSSVEAGERIIGARRRGIRGRIRKPEIDAEAARIIAERWLARQAPSDRMRADDANREIP